MAGPVIAGLIISVIAIGVSVGMSVDASNKAEDRQKEVDDKQDLLTAAQNKRASVNMLRTAAKGRIENELSIRLNKRRGNKLRGNMKMKTGASGNYRTADAEVDRRNNKRSRYPTGNTVVG